MIRFKQAGFLIALFTAVFTFQVLDVPVFLGKQNPKTCCGRVICQCTHAKGAFCPFKKSEKTVLPPASGTAHKHCHLPAKQDTRKIETGTPSPVRGWTKAPCASDAPKSTLPGYSRDSILPVAEIPLQILRAEKIPPHFFQQLYPVDLPSLKRPPKALLSL